MPNLVKTCTTKKVLRNRSCLVIQASCRAPMASYPVCSSICRCLLRALIILSLSHPSLLASGTETFKGPHH